MAVVGHLSTINALESLAEMNEKGRNRLVASGDRGDEELVCPKPRRVVVGITSGAVEMYKPVRRLRGSSTLPGEGEAGHEILEILFNKVNSGDTVHSGSPIPYFCGSPPSRAGNPLIHDVHFTHTRVPPPPAALPKKPCNSSFGSHSSFKKSSCSSSYVSIPSVRIEGFASSTSDSLQGVPAFA